MENEYAFYPDAGVAENSAVEEAPISVEQPDTEPALTISTQPESVPELSLLARVTQAYDALQTAFAERQQLVQKNRTDIAALRSKIHALTAANVNEDGNEDELHNGKLQIQHDSCNRLISHTEQIREHIYNNSDHAASLLIPLKASVDLLETRIQYVRTLEQLLKNIKESLAMQDHLLEIDLMIESLANKIKII